MRIPHGITEHVEGVDGNRQENPWPERQPGRLLHVLPPFPAEQTTPAGNLDGQTESEEAQRRLGNDDAANFGQKRRND